MGLAYRPSGNLRTRCPGPTLDSVHGLAAEELPRSTLRRNRFTLYLRARPVWPDDGYGSRVTGALSLTVGRGRITHHIFTAP
jgi:hypothetical protein